MDINSDFEMNLGNADAPIGVFDSGVGGISVLKEAARLLPNEDFLFFGDSANAPYGTKRTEVIRELAFKNVEFLLSKGIKALIIACNTATGAAIKELRAAYPKLPIVGIEPAIKPAVEKFPTGHILVMATPMTLKQEKFKNLLERYRGDADIVPMACPGLMEYVERGELDSASLNSYLEQVLTIPEWDNAGKSYFDGIVLGCTHYPFVKAAIRRIVGETPVLFDGAYGTARELKRRMDEMGVLRTDLSRTGEIMFLSSAPNSEEKEALMKYLYNQ